MTAPTIATPSQPPSRIRVGAWLTLASGLVGLLVSAWLVRLKFGADHLCDASGCPGGDDGPACAEALASGWSQLLGLPLGVWSIGHVVTTMFLAAAVLRRRGPLAEVAAPALLALGALGVAVSLALGLYAFTQFAHMCPFCLALYGTLTVAFVGALLVRGAAPTCPEGQTRVGAARAVLIWALATGGTALAYQLAARSVTCPPPPPDPPPVTIAATVDAPRAAVMLFVDPTCPLCRRELHLLQQSLPRLRAHGAELWVYMFPRANCDERYLPSHEFVDGDGKPQTHGEARSNNACLGALAALCTERLAPGRGLDGLAALFDLQDTEAPRFTTAKVEKALAEVAEVLGPGGKLRTCIDGEEASAALAAQQRYLLAWVKARGGRVGVPQAFVVPIVDGQLHLDQAMPATSAGKILKLVEAPGAK
ncbi:vitamin K epoxide reductase family protein [Nannocystis pusilla]|uniref:vitamin K epoxide reductase family protein n=1 Tax=Nannocystis pusilla TaxID=889268 RepID=UPI003BF2281A